MLWLDPEPALLDTVSIVQALNCRKKGSVMQTSVAADELKALIERIERLEEEKSALASDIRDVYSEAKANGFDTKILRKVVGIRKKNHAERQEEEAILELYLQALGMQA
jgi:uncharacterized protein (UPF0335 family)